MAGMQGAYSGVQRRKGGGGGNGVAVPGIYVRGRHKLRAQIQLLCISIINQVLCIIIQVLCIRLQVLCNRE